MPIHIEWLNPEKTIIKHTYQEPWTVKEYYELIQQNYAMIASVGHTVDVVNDLRGLQKLPPDIIAAMRHATHHAHPNEGMNIMVAANRLTQMLIDNVYSSAKRNGPESARIVFVDTLEEALSLIQAGPKAGEG